MQKDRQEAAALGLPFNSSFIKRMRHSKNMLFGQEFMNDLTDLEESKTLLRQHSSKILDMMAMQHSIPITGSIMN